MSFLAELKRRNVFRVAAAYIAVAWLLIQVVETLFPMFDLSEAAARTVVIVLAIGFIPVLILSWVFELTPDGFKRDSEVDRGTPSAVAMGKRLDRIVIVALVLAVGYFAVDKFVFDPARDVAREQAAREEGRTEALVGSYGNRSIAVLPFVNMSSDPEQEFFSDGIAEELLNLLARIPELRVISRSSAFSFKGSDLEIPEIARRLNTAHVLEGSVRKAGNKIRVTAQLIEASTDTHLWSESYDRELEDIFQIQDEIAADVVLNLKVELLGNVPTTPRTDPKVYELTLQAKHIAFSGGSNDDSEKVEALLEQALAIDPDYVPALLLIGLVDYWLYIETPEAEAMHERNRVRRAKVQELAPNHPQHLGWIAWDLFEHEKDLEGAARAYEDAIRTGYGDAEVLRSAAAFARHIGQFEAAIALATRSVELDPLCFDCLWLLGNIYHRADMLDEALESRKRYMELGQGGAYTLGLIHLQRGEPAEALATFEGDGMNDYSVQAARAMALHDLGRVEKSRAAQARQIELYGQDDPRAVAEAYAWMGDADKAFEWLDKAYGEDIGRFFTQVHAPVWIKIRNDPRWHELTVRAGMPKERLAAIEFNPVLPD